jgi:large subunit ribosomal protein L16
LVVRELIPLRQFLMKCFKGISKVWTRFLPQKVITKKPEEVRMGKGKGKFFSWIAPVKAGMILFEFSDCVLTRDLQSKLDIVMRKISIKTKLVKRPF